MWPKMIGGGLGFILIPLILVMGGILLNKPMLFEAPGFVKRMSLYFRYNVAETTVSPVLPELRIRRYTVPSEVMQKAVERTLSGLPRWKIVSFEPELGVYHAEVTSRLWRFKDDVSILVADRNGEVEVYLHSLSRVGRADLGANRHHILEFYEALEAQLTTDANH